MNLNAKKNPNMKKLANQIQQNTKWVNHDQVEFTSGIRG